MAKTLKPSKTIWVAKTLHDVDCDAYFLRFRFRKLGGGVGTIDVLRSLHQDPRKIHERLLTGGAALPSSGSEALALIEEALAGSENSAILETSRVTGWHGPKTFVTRRWTIPRTAAIEHVGNANLDPCQGLRSGTLDRWRDGLRTPCEASSYLCFAIGTAFAAPLLDVIGEHEGAVFHLRGTSSSGKSLLQRAAQSCLGRAGKSDLPTFDITQTGLEELCWSRNDLLLCIDEHGRLDQSRGAGAPRQLSYMMASGRGRIRTLGVKPQYPDLQWKLIGLTSGEVPLESAAASRNDGERVRWIDTPVPDRSKGGVFDELDPERHGGMTSAALAGIVEEVIGQNYGVALEPYICGLVRHRSKVREIAIRRIEIFVHDVGARDSWEQRFARKFAIVSAGMVIAAKLELAPWEEARAREAAQRLYRATRRVIFSPSDAAEALLAAVRENLSNREMIPNLEEGEALGVHLRKSAIGFRRRHSPHGDIVALNPEWVEAQLGSMRAVTLVMQHLRQAGVAILGSDGKSTIQIAVKGFDRADRPRWICLRYSKLMPV